MRSLSEACWRAVVVAVVSVFRKDSATTRLLLTRPRERSTVMIDDFYRKIVQWWNHSVGSATRDEPTVHLQGVSDQRPATRLIACGYTLDDDFCDQNSSTTRVRNHFLKEIGDWWPVLKTICDQNRRDRYQPRIQNTSSLASFLIKVNSILILWLRRRSPSLALEPGRGEETVIARFYAQWWTIYEKSSSQRPLLTWISFLFSLLLVWNPRL